MIGTQPHRYPYHLSEAASMHVARPRLTVQGWSPLTPVLALGKGLEIVIGANLQRCGAFHGLTGCIADCLFPAIRPGLASARLPDGALTVPSVRQPACAAGNEFCSADSAGTPRTRPSLPARLPF